MRALPAPRGIGIDVRIWHIADVPLVLTNVCFGGQSGHGPRAANLDL